MQNRIFILSILVLVIGLVAAGCGGGGGGNPVAPQPAGNSVADLSGVVKLNDVPLANAKVFLYPSGNAYMAGISQLSGVKASLIAQTAFQDGSYSTTTDDAGVYRFKSIPVGEYTLIAAKDQSHQFAQTGVILGQVTQVDAQLTPTGSVSGTVQITNGTVTENVAGAIVYLDGTSYVGITGVDGAFTLTNVPANQSFVLNVISSRGVQASSPTITITPGQTISVGTISLTAPTAQTGTISGQIAISGVTPPNASLSNHMVLLTSANKPPLVNVTDDNGNFSFIISNSGTYRVTPIPENYSSTPQYQDITATIGNTSVLSQTFNLTLDSNPAVYTVRGKLVKVAKAFNEADDGGIPVTLTKNDSSAITYASVTAPDGSFSIHLPPGDYNFAIGGGYKFESAFTANPITISGDYTFSSSINVIPSEGIFYNVSGTVNKIQFVNGDFDQSNVTVFLKSNDPAVMPIYTLSAPNGFFSAKVPQGTYDIRVTGSYELVTVPAAVVVNADYDYGTLSVRPALGNNGIIGGVISPTATINPYKVRLEPVSPSTYSNEVIADSSGNYRFSNVPAGTYKVVVVPSGNGYYAESSTNIVLNAGQIINNENLSAVNLAPDLTSVSLPDLNTLNLAGVRFLGANPSQTKVYVDGNEVARTSGFTLVDTADQADISTLVPGSHKVQIKKLWLRPLTAEIYTLSSPMLSFTKPLAAPTSLIVQEVTNTSVKFSWVNPPFAQQTEVELWQGGTQIGLTDVVSGNFYERQNLIPTTTYEIRIRSKRGSIVSGNTVQTFTTKATANYGISTVKLAGTDSLLTSAPVIFGFAAMNGDKYIAYTAMPSGSYLVYVNRFDSSGNYLGQISPIDTGLAAMPGKNTLGMVAGGGKIYVHYWNGSNVILRAYNADLTPAGGTDTIPVGNVTGASMVFAGNKLFLSGTASPDVQYSSLGYFPAPPDLSSSTVIFNKQTNAGIGEGYLLKCCADESDNALYVAVATGSSQLDSIEIVKFQLDNPAAATSTIALVRSPMPPGVTPNIALRQFKVGAGKFWVRFAVNSSGWTEFYSIVDKFSGYATTSSGGINEFSYRGDYAVDNKGRIWMAQMINYNGVYDNYFVNISPEGTVLKSLKVKDFPDYYPAMSYPFPNPAEFIKIDEVNKSVNMLFKDFDGFLSVYNYPSDF
ncbi:MAG: hypothetical protein Kow0029_14710 [Candidatus Rifleibacteriota bacterium]